MKKEILSKDNLSKIQVIGIYGNTGSGKTALAYKILEAMKPKKVYFIKHPRKELLDKFGYENLESLEEIERLSNCIIFWDEPQLSTGIYDKRSNIIISKVCSLARQRNITLIISSSDTRVFSKSNEAYFDLWLVKDIDYFMVKQGSMLRKIIKNNSVLEPNGFRLEKNEFLSSCRNLYKLNGKHTFTLPKGWSEAISKPFSNHI